MEDTVSGDFHHTVAHGRSCENTYCGDCKNCLELGHLGADGRLEEIDSVVAHADHEVENREHEQKHHKPEINCFHTLPFYTMQRWIYSVIQQFRKC